VIPIEAVQFLQEATAAEALNKASASSDQDADEEEDLVCLLLIFASSGHFSLILVRSDLEQTLLEYSRELSLVCFLLGNDHFYVYQ
jgi:DMSO/TMAO reductase YedYZ heme-binding membrane subunit